MARRRKLRLRLAPRRVEIGFLRGRDALGRLELPLELFLAVGRAQHLRLVCEVASVPILDLVVQLALTLTQLGTQPRELVRLGADDRLGGSHAPCRLVSRLKQLSIGRLGRRTRRRELRGHLAYALDEYLAVGTPLSLRLLGTQLGGLLLLASIEERLFERREAQLHLVSVMSGLLDELRLLLLLAQQRLLPLLRGRELLLEGIALRLHSLLRVQKVARVAREHAPVRSRARELLLEGRVLLRHGRAQLDYVRIALRDRRRVHPAFLGQRRRCVRKGFL